MIYFLKAPITTDYSIKEILDMLLILNLFTTIAVSIIALIFLTKFVLIPFINLFESKKDKQWDTEKVKKSDYIYQEIKAINDKLDKMNNIKNSNNNN